jgi:3-hydroxybutyryl-CoA dehydrogenase
LTIKAEDIKTVAVVGAGLMGHGIAQLFARSGRNVRLMDVSDEILARAIDNVRSNLTIMASKGVGSADEIDAIVGRIRTTTLIEEAVTGADYAVEAVSENVQLKQRVFNQLDELCPPEVILATNTSVISITEIASGAHHKERIVGTHFWNPPHVMPLVEVIKGAGTADEVAETACQVLTDIGQYPVKVLKDVPGFIGNRLQHALWREAISIVERGIADAAAVDDVVKKGFGIRLPVLGPLENIDMIGLDLTLAIHEYLMGDIESSPVPQKLLRDKVANGELGFKSGQGFSAWTPEEAQKSKERLLRHLLDTLKRE